MASEAVVDGELRLTYEQFGRRCDRWSAALWQLGVRPGDRVATIAPNTHQHLEQYYAVPQLGAVIVPMNYRLMADDFVYLANHSGSKVLCVHADYLDAVDSVRGADADGRALRRARRQQAGLARLRGTARRAATGSSRGPTIAEGDLLSINYTSGTTSRPKGVMITHRNAWVNAVGTLAHLPMTPADRYLWTLPMFHANGWTFTWIVTAAAARTSACGRSTPRSIYRLVNEEGITHALRRADGADRDRQRAGGGPPRRCAAACACSPPARRPPPPRSSASRASSAGPSRRSTGSPRRRRSSPSASRCPSTTRSTAADRARIKARQGVELITSGELRVVDENLQDVPRDGATLGEIVVRGNVVMKGYYNDPEATAQAFRGGWFHTGDAAVVHPDGYVEIRDRYKDVIISGGENISSIEVEGALLRHPAVLEVAVVGMPHEQWGESPHAFVVLRPGAARRPTSCASSRAARLAHFKVPTAFTFVTELPKTATGKIQKFVLRGGKAAIARQ